MWRDYSAPTGYRLNQVVVYNGQSQFYGRGFMNWDARDGFTLKAFMERSGPPLPEVRQYKGFFLHGPDDVQYVRVRLDRSGWAIIPSWPLSDNFDLIEEGHLELRTDCALFGRRWPRDQLLKWYGHALFQKRGHVGLPDVIKSEARVAERQINRHIGGRALSHQDGDLEITCWEQDSEFLSLQWSLDKSRWSRAESWRFAQAVELAFSILFGQNVRMVERHLDRDGCEYCERRRMGDVDELGLFSPVGVQTRYKRETIVSLIRFLAGNSREAQICQRIFAQLAEAGRQETRQGQDLLCATILEAVLRTLDSCPFIPGKRHPKYSVKDGLKRFQNRHLTAKWDSACDRVLQAFDRVRHRNAHPDWLVGVSGQNAPSASSQEIDDVLLLSRFYGYVILALAGFKPLESQFPPPCAEWPASMTVTGPPRGWYQTR